jgi:hypothetical protein
MANILSGTKEARSRCTSSTAMESGFAYCGDTPRPFLKKQSG